MPFLEISERNPNSMSTINFFFLVAFHRKFTNLIWFFSFDLLLLTPLFKKSP